MLRLEDADPRLIDKLGTLAARVVEDALASGPGWDQAIVAPGGAAKAMSATAAGKSGAAPWSSRPTCPEIFLRGSGHRYVTIREFASLRQVA